VCRTIEGVCRTSEGVCRTSEGVCRTIEWVCRINWTKTRLTSLIMFRAFQLSRLETDGIDRCKDSEASLRKEIQLLRDKLDDKVQQIYSAEDTIYRQKEVVSLNAGRRCK